MLMQNHRFDFQTFIQTRLGFGKYQYLAILSLIMVQMTDGIQAITISLVTPVLKAQLQLTQNQVSLFASIFFIGVGIGALSSGILSNIYGRKPALIFGILAQTISGLLLGLKLNFQWMCMLRMIYGTGFGSTLAVATLIATECLPMNYRGKGLLIINAFTSIGKLIAIVLAFFFLHNNQKNWSQYMVSSTLPCLAALILSCIFVKQSYRFMLSKHSFQQAYILMNEVILSNHKNREYMLREEEKNQIQSWARNIFTTANESKCNTSLLLKQKKKVIFLSLSWFFVATVTFGQLFIVPFMLPSNDQGLIKFFWMTLGELPSLALTYLLIDRQGYGRKKSLIIFFSLSSLFCLYVVISLNSFSLFLAKLIIKASFQMLYPFTSESYSTNIRSIAFAINSVMGRIGSAIMPFILYPLFLSYQNSPFMILAICSLFGGICICQIKEDTFQKPLDQKKANDLCLAKMDFKDESNTEQSQMR